MRQLWYQFYIDPLIDTSSCVLLAWCMQALRQHEVGPAMSGYGLCPCAN